MPTSSQPCGRPPNAAPANDRTREAAALNETLVQEFLAADVVVVGAPMYNFSVPTQLKAWIDRVAQAGRTFRYTANGPTGRRVGRRKARGHRLESRRQVRGSGLRDGTRHQEAYLRAFFGSVGISDVTVVRAEGVAMGPESTPPQWTQRSCSATRLPARIATDAIEDPKRASEAVTAE